MARPSTVLTGVVLLALATIVAVGILQATRNDQTASAGPPLTAAQVRSDLAGSPAPLAALHAQAGLLLGGGEHAVDARLVSLRGYPVVVNKWASWCVPCRTEFPIFARAAAALGARVAFLGVDSQDRDGDARTFLAGHPVSYPSYADADGDAGTAISLSSNFPVTVFYTASGQEAIIHQGAFTSVPELETYVRRYALSPAS